jgi:hypothetical protein
VVSGGPGGVLLGHCRALKISTNGWCTAGVDTRRTVSIVEVKHGRQRKAVRTRRGT